MNIVWEKSCISRISPTFSQRCCCVSRELSPKPSSIHLGSVVKNRFLMGIIFETEIFMLNANAQESFGFICMNISNDVFFSLCSSSTVLSLGKISQSVFKTPNVTVCSNQNQCSLQGYHPVCSHLCWIISVTIRWISITFLQAFIFTGGWIFGDLCCYKVGICALEWNVSMTIGWIFITSIYSVLWLITNFRLIYVLPLWRNWDILHTFQYGSVKQILLYGGCFTFHVLC